MLVLLVMRMLGEMAVALPTTSSFTEFARVGLGPWAGFICGWLYWYFWVITVGVETIAGANLIQPWLQQSGLDFQVWEIGLVLVALMTATNLFSVAAFGEGDASVGLTSLATSIPFSS